jgi:hypothetical protein
MSYDISLYYETLGGHVGTGFSWNYTSNCAPMWRAAGAQIHEWDGKQVSEVLEELREAITKLEAEPDTYTVMNPSNGWGAYERLIPALKELLEAFEEKPHAKIYVSR